MMSKKNRIWVVLDYNGKIAHTMCLHPMIYLNRGRARCEMHNENLEGKGYTIKKVEAEEKLAEKDKELKVRGDFILNCCNLHCTSDNCPMRPECSIYLKNHPKE